MFTATQTRRDQRKQHHSVDMGAFQLFPQLPLELRRRIWGFSVQPREATVRRHEFRDLDLPQCWCSPTLTPAVLHACRESRSFLASTQYKQSFVHETCPLYIWINFAIDTIRVTVWDADSFCDERYHVTRLTLESEPNGREDLMFINEQMPYVSQFLPLERLTIMVYRPFGENYMNWLYFLGDIEEQLLPQYPPFDAKIFDSTGLELNSANWRGLKVEYRKAQVEHNPENYPEGYVDSDEDV